MYVIEYITTDRSGNLIDGEHCISAASAAAAAEEFSIEFPDRAIVHVECV